MVNQAASHCGQAKEEMSSQLLVQHMIDGANFYRARGLGDAASDAASRSAALLQLDASFSSWRDQVLTFADSTDDSEGNAAALRNAVASAARSFNRFIGGDLGQGAAMQRTMSAAMDLIRQIGASNMPSLQDVYDTTGGAIRSLTVSVASTAGEAGGALIKSAADQVGVKPADIGSGVGKIALAAIVVGGAVALTQAKSIIGMFKGKRKNPRRRRRAA